MCIAIPMQVQQAAGLRAWCSGADGARVSIDTALVGPLEPGTWVLCFLGAAREVISEARALQVSAALGALARLMSGEAAAIEVAFADLVGREPQLPEFLRRPKER